MNNVVIIGSGHAGGQCAITLRNAKFDGSITIIGEENYPPYQRPPLSKGFLSGEVDINRVYLKKDEFYKDNNISLMINSKVTDIDKDSKLITLENNQEIQYTNLVLATGSRVRKLDVEGITLKNIGYLRDINDVNALKPYLIKDANIAIVGAGYIGLEVAAIASKIGANVTVIEMANRVMNRTVDPLISSYYHKLHERKGVKILLNTSLDSFEGNSKVEYVICSDGSKIKADAAIIGAGIIPNTELAQQAGIDCENGILVNEFCETNIKNIFACGDCTNHPNKLLNKRLRLESVHNALEQAKTVSYNILNEKIAYNQIPWFWSDQYDHKLQIVGISGDHDEVIMRGSKKEETFILFYLKKNKLIACNAVNNPKEFLICKKLVANQVKISSDELINRTLNLSEIV